MKKGYVYKFEGTKGEIIYIGRTNNLDRRMKEHLKGRGHKPKECYEEITKIKYMEVKDMEKVEGYLIRKYKPKYNKVLPKSTKWYVKEDWKVYSILKECRLEGRKDANLIVYIIIMLYLIYKILTGGL